MSSIDRREALKRMAILAGGTLSASTVSAVMGGCRAGDGSRELQTLNQHQNRLVITLSEHIIPETDTPGAKAANVNQFVDQMLTEWNYPDERKAFLKGLARVDTISEKEFNRKFLKLDAEKQKQIMKKLEEESVEKIEGGYKPFFAMIKEYTVVGYFTSEIGGKDVLGWTAVPGEYKGDMDDPPDIQLYS